MGRVPDESAVQELTAASADPAFGDRVHAGRRDVAGQGPDPGIGEDRVERPKTGSLAGPDTTKPGDVQQEVLRDPVEDTSGEKIQDGWKGRQRSSDRTPRSRSCRRRCSAWLGARVTAV
jgi:hypothetical protein